MSEHITHCEDKLVRGHRGTVAYCTCGWRDAWSIQGGNAEASAHGHAMKYDTEYKQAHKERVAEAQAELTASGCTCEKFTDSYGYVLDINCPVHRVRYVQSKPSPVYEHYHGCSCHLDPPCSQCVNCNHPYPVDCGIDCQECEIDHDV